MTKQFLKLALLITIVFSLSFIDVAFSFNGKEGYNVISKDNK